MLDPIAALGLAGNIVQFVDFSMKLVGKAHEIHKSVDGALAENLDTETVARTLRKLQSKLKIDEKHNTSYDNETEGMLEGLCESCDETAKELLDILEGFKARGKMTPWKSMRHAIKNVKGKAAVLEISARLGEFRRLLDTTILVELRKTIDLHLVANSASFKTLEASTQNIILAVNENRSVFTTVVETKTAELKALHVEEAVLSADRHEDITATITATVTETKVQHETTRREIAIRAATEAAEMKAHMDKRTDEIKDLIMATNKAKGKTERKRLMEKTNAATASLVAMDLIYNSLIGILAQTDSNHGRDFWKLSPHDYEKPVRNISRSRPQPELPSSRTVVDLPSSREASIASNPYPFGYLPEVGLKILPPRLRPHTISVDRRSSTDSSCSDPSASSREDDISSRTDYEMKTPEPRTRRVHDRNIHRDFDAKTAGRRKKHSAKPSVAWHNDDDDDGDDIGPSWLPRVHSPNPFAPYAANQTSPTNVPPGYGAGYPAAPIPGNPGAISYPLMNDTTQYGYPGYLPQMRPGMPQPGHGFTGYYPPWPPSEVEVGGDPELERKLLAVEELMKAQKIDYEKAQKEIAERDAAAAARMAAEQEAKHRAETAAMAEKRASEERAAWEKKLQEERQAAMAKGAANAMNAERKRIEQEEIRQREIAAAVQAARDELLAEKMAEEETRAKRSIIPWPAWWKR